MPRPSDLYATLGAPGVYQATPWTPCVLPNVFVCPPEEDNEDVYCLFYSGSAVPSTYESFYGNPGHARRENSNTTYSAFGHALSFVQQQASVATGAPVFTRQPGWEHGENVVMPMRNFSGVSSASSYSSGSVRASSFLPGSGTTAFPNLNFVVEKEGPPQGQGVRSASPKPHSRRSSVFGERPSDREVFGNRPPGEEGRTRPGLKKSQTMTLKSRAAVALKSIGGQRTKTTASDPPPPRGHETAGVSKNLETFFARSRGATPPPKRSSRRTLAQLFGSNFSSADVTTASPTIVDFASYSPATPFPPPPEPAYEDLKLSKRKSITQLFGMARSSSADVSQVHKVHPGFPRPSATPASLSTPVVEPKLSRRKSVTQLFGLGRRASSTPALAVVGAARVETDASGVDTAEARLATLRALEGPVPSFDLDEISRPRPPSHRAASTPSVASAPRHISSTVSTSAPPLAQTTAKSSRRQSFLRSRPFSFLDVQRHFSTTASDATQPTGSTALSTPPSVRELLDSPSDATDSLSSTPVSTDSDAEGVDVVRILETQVGTHNPSAELLSNEWSEKDEVVHDLSSRFSLHEPKDVDIDFEGGADDEPALELATRIDSLHFGQLAFDPESFIRAVEV